MRKIVIAVSIIASILISTSIAYAQYDPALFAVTPEKDCYILCPSGDLSFSFCISYDGQPLAVSAQNVFMKIECLSGSLFICPYECADKCAYIRESDCVASPGGGAEYSWSFRAGGCCEQLQISLHMRDDQTPFYTTTVFLKSPDIDGNGKVDQLDENILLGNMGISEPCSDLNCDGIVNELDHQILSNHLNHNCNEMIGTQESSWGSIKAIYKN